MIQKQFLLRLPWIVFCVLFISESNFRNFYPWFLPYFYLKTVRSIDLLERSLIPAQNIENSALMGILYIGIFASLWAFILWNKAIAIIGAVNAGMVYYSLPIFSGILAIFILGESITSLHLYSTLLVLAGILLAVVYNPKSLGGP